VNSARSTRSHSPAPTAFASATVIEVGRGRLANQPVRPSTLVAGPRAVREARPDAAGRLLDPDQPLAGPALHDHRRGRLADLVDHPAGADHAERVDPVRGQAEHAADAVRGDVVRLVHGRLDARLAQRQRGHLPGDSAADDQRGVSGTPPGFFSP
jgi:hypothetical protein